MAGLARIAPFEPAPRGWTITGEVDARWRLENGNPAPSKSYNYVQTGTAAVSLALKDGIGIKDGFVQTKFKVISESKGPAAGLVWRAQDANNYYLLRACETEGNVVLFKTVHGIRSPLNTVADKRAYGAHVAIGAPGMGVDLEVEVLP